MKKHHPRNLGDRLLQELEALRAELSRHACDTGQISIGPREACDVRERVARVDDERCGLYVCGDDSRRPRAHGEQDIDRNLHEVRGQPRHPVVSAIRESLLEDEVLPFDVTLFRQANPKNIEMGTLRTRTTNLQPTNPPHSGGPLRLDHGRYSEQAYAESENNREPDPPHPAPPSGWLRGV